MADLMVVVALLASLALLGVPLLKLSKKLIRTTLIGAGVLWACSLFLVFYEML